VKRQCQLRTRLRIFEMRPTRTHTRRHAHSSGPRKDSGSQFFLSANKTAQPFPLTPVSASNAGAVPKWYRESARARHKLGRAYSIQNGSKFPDSRRTSTGGTVSKRTRLVAGQLEFPPPPPPRSVQNPCPIAESLCLMPANFVDLSRDSSACASAPR